jgi:hypothetical protein
MKQISGQARGFDHLGQTCGLVAEPVGNVTGVKLGRVVLMANDLSIGQQLVEEVNYSSYTGYHRAVAQDIWILAPGK